MWRLKVIVKTVFCQTEMENDYRVLSKRLTQSDSSFKNSHSQNNLREDKEKQRDLPGCYYCHKQGESKY